MNKHTLKTQHIPDQPILDFLQRLSDRGWSIGASLSTGYHHSVDQGFPVDTPYKLIRSKMKSLIKRGLVDGCSCGDCRGDFTLVSERVERPIYETPEKEPLPLGYVFAGVIDESGVTQNIREIQKRIGVLREDEDGNLTNRPARGYRLVQKGNPFPAPSRNKQRRF